MEERKNEDGYYCQPHREEDILVPGPGSSVTFRFFLLAVLSAAGSVWFKSRLDQSAQRTSGLLSPAVLCHRKSVSGICGKYRGRTEYISFFLLRAVQSGHSPFLSASFCEDVRLYYGGTVCLSGSFRDPCLSLAQKPEVRREDLFWHCGAVSSGGANDFSFL